MIDIQDINYTPSIEEINEYVRNDSFKTFCNEMDTVYEANCKIEFSRCGWEYGWNIKYKKSGKLLCTVYPRENYFTILAAVGRKEKEMVESILPDCSSEIQDIYYNTKEGNGQRWLMIDLEYIGEVYNDVLKLIQILYKTAGNKKL